MALLPLLYWIGGSGIFLCLIMASAWLAQRVTGKSGWADVAWTLGLGLTGAVLALAPLGGSPEPMRQRLVAALALIWALRLGGHILLRTLGGGEDPRYRQLAVEWGETFPSRLFGFLQIQAVCALFLALCVLLAAHAPGPLRWSDAAGAVLLAIAIAGEGLSDFQLAQFRANPANGRRVCDRGLWAHSRHPNYFFEWLAWLAYPLIAIDPTGGYLWGWFALAGPAFMYWLLVHVSGVPPLEAHMLRSRGQAYEAYQAKVSVFFPVFSARDSQR